jgi:homoserine O-succinyltransferase
MRGLDQVFKMPQSRYATVSVDDINRCSRLHVAALDKDRDPGIVISEDGMVFITGHMEYDTNTLANEYDRDVNKGIEPAFPINYYTDDDPRFDPVLSWRSYSMLLFINWLNYYVYQMTPFDINKIKQ